jgi:ComF family protein
MAVSASDDPLVCDLCRLRWKSIPAPRCDRCGEWLPLNINCRLCSDWPVDFGGVRSAVFLDPAVRQLVHRFKYQGWHRLAESFATVMPTTLPGMHSGVDLVPIPLGNRRLRSRGYNQADVLAKALGAQCGLPVRPERLSRVRETGTQTKLAPEARLANLSSAFAALGSRRPALLVDDVFTTGATLVSAAVALLDAGAPSVSAVTFARALPPLMAAAEKLRGSEISFWNEAF